jgi:NAD(P)-dependent dehydrogenase (short-subunit alcohol dehydrogenase family)
MSDTPTVLITGCSSGIGNATAQEMKDRGWSVWATARKPEDLEQLRREGLNALELDVSDPASIDQAVRTLREATGGHLKALVNNAGFGQPGALEDLTRDQLRYQFEVNVFGLLDLTHRLLPDLMRDGDARLVHISSVVGRVALPFMGIYSASKFAVEALADVQRIELNGTGIRVSLVEPGPIRTEFSTNAVSQGSPALEAPESRFAGLYKKTLAKRRVENGAAPFALPPEAVAAKIAHALTSPRPRRRYRVTLPAQFGAFASRFFPDALIDVILARELRKQQSDSDS